MLERVNGNAPSSTVWQAVIITFILHSLIFIVVAVVRLELTGPLEATVLQTGRLPITDYTAFFLTLLLTKALVRLPCS